MKNLLLESLVALRGWVANYFLGKDNAIINLKGIEALPVDQRVLLATMLDIKSMFLTRKYDMLIRLGQLEGFIERGLADELIARYPKYQSEIGPELSGKVISLVTEEMLEDYIKNPASDEFGFYIIHPLGLKILAEHEFTGFIAAHEEDFRRNAEEFPDSVNSQRDYITLLNRVLD